MEERKSQCDGESEVFDNLEELKESFQRLANFFGFTTQIQTSNENNSITMEQKQGNKYISYRTSGNNKESNIRMGIHSDNKHDQDILFAIYYGPNCCRLRLLIPTYEIYSERWQNGRLVSCDPYTVCRNSYIDINTMASEYCSRVYGGVITLSEGNYCEQRPVSWQIFIAIRYRHKL